MMGRKPHNIHLGFVKLDRSSELPLHRQLYETLQVSILEGRLEPGVRLPSSRALAHSLGLSRNTVSRAYTQLLTEGYIESLVGSGTHVTRTLPETLLQAEVPSADTIHVHSAEKRTRARLSRRGRQIADLPYEWENKRPGAFVSGIPAVDVFPKKIWEKLLVSTWRDLSINEMGYQSALGYLPLREALARYLQTARGVNCSAEQVIITNGAQQAIGQIANILLDRGDKAWVENPCYPGIRAAMRSTLANMVPIDVDDEGLRVEGGIAQAPDARLAYISPSNQYPLGVTMSLSRRLTLLNWANEQRAWIVEDDYDSEFRYSGSPIASIQGLDRGGRVIYVGTFSKVLYPALRIGYMIAPKSLLQPLHAARAHADRGASILEQAVLAQFIQEGHLVRHIRRMRTLYATRQNEFMENAQRFLGNLLVFDDANAGLHMIGWLPDGVDDQVASQRLQAHGIIAPALSSFAFSPLPRGGLVIGFGAINVNDMAMAVKRMWGVLEDVVAGR